MSAITLGPSGLPVQLTPVLPQTPPAPLLQQPPLQPPTAVAPVDRQAGGGAGKEVASRREGQGAPPTGGRARLVDIKA
jgi:hypothetical protein